MRYRPPIAFAIGGLALSFLIYTNTAYAQEQVMYEAPLQDVPEVVEVDGEHIKVLSIEYTETAQSPCALPSDCNVPAPTVIQPGMNQRLLYGSSITITGLSWNQTKVDVYIDGIYNGRADLRTDPSEVGNFVYRPFLPLTPGAHTLYTVARNLSELERSPQSQTISFDVVALKPLAPVTQKEPEQKKLSDETLDAMGTTQEATATASSANSFLDWFFNKTGESGTGTATSTSGFVRPRTFVIAVLVLTLLGIGYWMFGRRAGPRDTTTPTDQHAPPEDDQPRQP
ncbi:MAG: hypothetical protein HY422_02320 [Candidatus Komeilibacteria bacterium]|nr:hypothetical protein [Candidatus Komeilibacteria bacterium]